MQTKEELRKEILDDLDRLGSLQYTAKMLRELFNKIEAEFKVLERQSGIKNWIFRLLLQALKPPQDQSENVEARRDIEVAAAWAFRLTL
jgi:hypothetical protein